MLNDYRRGLARREQGVMNQQINLFHPIFRKEAKKFSAATSVQAAAIIIVGAALIYAVEYWQIGKLRAEQVSVQKEEVAAQRRLDQIAQTLSTGGAKTDIETKIAGLEAEIESRTRIGALLSQEALGNSAGYSQYLTSFARQHVDGVWLTGIHITGKGDDVVLKGRSVSPALVPRYIQRLAGEASLSGTDFKVFRITRPEDEKHRLAPYVEFRAGTTQSDKREMP